MTNGQRGFAPAIIIAIVAFIVGAGSAFYFARHTQPSTPHPLPPPAPAVETPTQPSQTPEASTSVQAATPLSPSFTPATTPYSLSGNETKTTPIPSPSPAASKSEGGKVYTNAELLAMADDSYANGEVPLGDGRQTTAGPKKGYIYLCRMMSGGGGAETNGSWIHGTTWNYLGKTSVEGNVSWSNASFSDTLSGLYRLLKGNGLPISHTTGIFPVQSSDPAYKIDRNPNTITAQNFSLSLSKDPVYSDTPYCMGGEVGLMNTGVPIFNGVDAEGRDAPAHEVQDHCDGHPQEAGEYHYHSLSSCFSDIGEETVLGFALDGFPITGPEVADKKFLTTDDLDECHGLTSEIVLDGKKTTMYHYVMTRDFPYTVSCFRGKPVSLMVGKPSGSSSGGTTQNGTSGATGGQQSGMKPPQEAIDACSGKSQGASCSVGPGTGTCRTTPDGSFACVPS